MKQFSTPNARLLKAICVVVVMLFAGMKSAYACHGVAIVNPTGTLSPTDITINGGSDPATCGCGPYWMEVEVTCDPNGFTGAPPAPSSPLWGTVPWYHSGLNPPAAEDCVLEPYFPITIPFSQLCPGTQYYWRVRELVENPTSPGPWSGVFTFTTPGLPPASILSASSSAYSGCPGDMMQLNASVSGGCPGATFQYLWSPATGLSNPNIANPVATLSTNITYTVTASGGCFTITSSDDTVSLTVGPPPAAGVPQAVPTAICSGQSSTITLTGNAAGAIQWEVSTNGINWFTIPGATNPTLNTGPLTSSLFFHAIVTGTGWPGSGCGSSTSPPVQVTVNPSPNASAGANTSVCSGGCTNLTGSGGVTYNWMPGNLSGSTVNVCPPGTTTYTVYVTDANGCSDSANVTVNISTPNVTASPSVSICTGNSTILVASGPSGQTYSWSPSATLTGANTANPTATPLTTTTYVVTATNQFGCTATDSVVVQVTAAPPVVASPDTSFCSGGIATLTATGSATSYNWMPGNQSTSTISVSPATTTTYVVTANTNNCISRDTVVVTVAPATPVYAGPDFSVCGGTQVTLNVGVSGGTYSWGPSGSIIGSTTTQSVTAAPTGNTSYTVNVTDANGCISSDTINVTVTPVTAVMSSTPDDTLCLGQSTFLNAINGVAYAWTPNIGLSSTTGATVNATPTNTTSYQVTATDANGCTSTSTLTIVVNPNPNVGFTSTPSPCGGTGGGIQFFGYNAGVAPFTYSINNSPVTMPLTGLAPGLYAVTYTDANGCTGLAGVDVYSIDPQIAFTSLPTECGDTTGQILFDFASAGVAPFTYQIGSTPVSMPATGLAAGNYTVQYTDANGCTGVTGVTVFTQNTAYVTASADPNFGTYPLPVNFAAGGSTGFTNWAWSFGDSNVGTGQTTGNTYGAPGVYTVVVVAYNSDPACAVTDTIYVTVVEEATMALPNIFTPNDDASNDFFAATVSGVSDINVEIYDRWGALIYKGAQGGLSAAPQIVQLWDGKNGSKTASDGVYYYVVTAIGYDLKQYPMQGFVHINTAKQ